MTSGGDIHAGDVASVIPTGANSAMPKADPDALPGGLVRLFAPFRYMFHPGECGRVMAASPWVSVFAYLVGMILIWLSVQASVIIDQMLDCSWGSEGATLIERGVAEAWALQGQDWMSPVHVSLLIFAMTAFWTLVATLVFAWISWPIVHRSGSALRSLGRSLRMAMGAVAGPGVVLVFMLSMSIAACTNALEPYWSGYSAVGNWELYELWLGANILGCWLAAAFLGVWIRRAAIGARSMVVLPMTAVTCEECGYDLTHLSEGGRCTECGADTVLSIDPAIRRSGIPWERQRTIASWTGSIWALVSNPRTFYQRLHMRSDEAPGFAFAKWNYVAIGLVSVVSICGIFFIEQPYSNMRDWIGIVSFGAVLPAIVAWLLHSLVGAIAATFLLFRHQPRPFAYLSKIWQYESAYLWMIVIVGHALAWSFVFFEDWMTEIARAVIGGSWFFIEPLVILGICIVLVIGWLLRFTRAIRVVRWANL